jgi:hypothetical protein
VVVAHTGGFFGAEAWQLGSSARGDLTFEGTCARVVFRRCVLSNCIVALEAAVGHSYLCGFGSDRCPIERWGWLGIQPGLQGQRKAIAGR